MDKQFAADDVFGIASGLNTSGARTDLANVASDSLFRAQRPYRNGVVVHCYSVWGGNGFGTDVSRVAVREGEVVGVYESGRTHQLARVLDAGSLTSDGYLYGHGANRRRIVTKTALTKWIEAVKAL